MRTYNVNGHQMSEEEFREFQEQSGFNFNFSGFGFNQRSKRWDHKPHLYQCYKNTHPGLWNEISLDELKKDINTSPKFLKTFSYVQSNAGEYIIKTQPVVVIFYNHQENDFLYMNESGIISEHNCFSSHNEALEAIKKLESKKENFHTLFDSNGNIIKQYLPEKSNDDSLSENMS